MNVKTLIDRVAAELLDQPNLRWRREDILNYLRDGLAIISDKRPDLAKTTVEVQNESGIVKLPDDCSQLISVNHADYSSCQFINMERLEQNYPRWRAERGEPSSWTREDLDESRFFLFPKPIEGTPIDVEFSYAKILTVTDEDADVPLKDNMIPYLFDFMMFRAYSRDGQSTSNSARAAAYYQTFSNGIGEKTQSDFSLKERVASTERRVSQ